MTFDTPETASSLMQKFQALYEQLTAFTSNIDELHNNLPVHDDASRAAFNSLSRILAFSDQLNMLVSLMREDVRIVEELVDPISSQWTNEIDRHFYEWLKSSKAAAPNVN